MTADPRHAQAVWDVADLVMIHSYYGGQEGECVTAEDRDSHGYANCLAAADAILARYDLTPKKVPTRS